MNPLKRSFRAAGALTATLLALSPAAQAVTPIGDYLTIGGFGTLGGVVTNNDVGQYGRDRQRGGATKDPALDVDSNLGVQLDAKATSWLSATVQVLTAKREDYGFVPQFEWAYVQVKPLDGLSIRGGRMGTPTFLVSDSRNIGYANNWLRAPNEVYGVDVFGKFDGADITYRRSLGPVSLKATVMAGKSQFRTIGLTGEGNSMRGANLEAETDWVTFRLGRIKTKVTVPGIGSDDPYTFTGYGATLDRDNFVAQAEFVQRRSGQVGQFVDANGYYAMGGYRFGTLLPYAIFSRTAPLHPNPIYVFSGEQRTTALGLRWDAFRSADLKFQIDRVDTKNSKGISFTSPFGPPAFPGAPASTVSPGKAVVFSVAMDFTF